LEPPLAFADALTQLKLLTSQTTNFTFTDDELTQALTEAWQNSYVCNPVFDSSTSFQSGTFTYAIPATMTVMQSIWYNPTTSTPLQLLDRRLYTIPGDGTFVFIDDACRWLSDTYTLYIKGRKKLAITDNLTTDGLVNYVISLAAFMLLKRLALKSAFQFLKNDTSMSEIIAIRNSFQSDVLTYKQALQREFEAI
jgi:hypothetical protein